jgi:N-acyl-D-amino-acid deacylase
MNLHSLFRPASSRAFVTALICTATGAFAATAQTNHDVILRGGTVYDGGGGKPFVADVALQGDRIAAIGDLAKARAKQTVNAAGLAVAPGFINPMSWAQETLIADGRSQSDIRQGVTLEVMGEDQSMGPLNPAMKADLLKRQGDIKYAIEWTTLGEFLSYLERRGVSCNVASFLGTATPRIHELGWGDRQPSPAELARMEALVRQAMEEGAMGLASALVYPPGAFAKKDELVALCRAAAPYGVRYYSHLRSEGTTFLEAVDELIETARAARIPAEIYHLKAAGKPNWPKMDAAIAMVEKARREGLSITADMYTYPAGSTWLAAMLPQWAQDGAPEEWIPRLRDPAVRARIIREMKIPSKEWENFLVLAGGPEGVLHVGFKTEALKPMTGKRLADVARLRGRPAEDTVLDLILEDGLTGGGCVFFMMSEDNLRKQIARPWVAFCSDSASLAPEGVFLKASVHPRAYGSFARLLAKYVREEKVISLEEAVRRLTLFPAENLKLKERGALRPGWFADVVVFDPAKVQDHATFEQPHQYATGMRHVFVNGVAVLRDGEHTGAKPGRFVRGPGWKPK